MMVRKKSRRSTTLGSRKSTTGTARRSRLVLETLEARQLLAATPRMLLDIEANPNGSDPNSFTELNGQTYFIARTNQLWRSNGSAAGTVMVKDFAAEGVNPSITDLAVHDGQLAIGLFDLGPNTGIFAVEDDQFQLWKSDGTTSGTSLVHDFGPSSSPVYATDGAYFSSLNGSLFLSVRTAAHGGEIWKSENLTTPTLLKDIAPAAASSDPTQLQVALGKLFFTADDGNNGYELWVSDGTTAGTTMVKDISEGMYGSYPTSGYGKPFPELNGHIFFGVRSNGPDNVPFNEDDTTQLWKSDGTSAGSVLVKDFGPPSDYGSGELVRVGSTIFGTASTLANGTELWKSDGTTAGTVLVKDIFPGTSESGAPESSNPGSLTNVDGVLYFSANDGTHGVELWKSDGTEVGTVLVKDINDASGDIFDSWPLSLTALNNELYFTADDGLSGRELWKSDGTSTGTVLVRDINPASDSSIWEIHVANNDLFFAADNGTGSEPWILNTDALRTDLTMRHPNGAVYVARSTGQNFVNEKWTTWANVEWVDVLAGDATGDGLSDLIARHPDGSVYVARSTGTSFVTQKWTTWANVAWQDVATGDFNGDGRTDLFARLSDGRVFVALSSGTSFSTQRWATWANVAWEDVLVGDFNGDGLDDVTMRHPNGSMYVARSTGSGFISEKWLTSPATSWSDTLVADFNGDGRSDLALRNAAGAVFVARSTGNAFVNQVWATWANLAWSDVLAADFTGDGRADLTMRHPTNGSVYVASSTGSSFITQKWGTWANVGWLDVQTGDYNGDGLADLAARHPNGRVFVGASTGWSLPTTQWTTWATISWKDVQTGGFVTGGPPSNNPSSLGPSGLPGRSSLTPQTPDSNVGPQTESGKGQNRLLLATAANSDLTVELLPKPPASVSWQAIDLALADSTLTAGARPSPRQAQSNSSGVKDDAKSFADSLDLLMARLS